MAATHKKLLTTTVRPGSLLSNQDIIAVVSGDTDIGGRIASVNDLRFSTAAGLWLEWMPIAFSLIGGSLTATFRIVRPTILSSEDLITEIHYGGTPDGSAPGPASTLSLPGLSLGWDCESVDSADWSGNGWHATSSGSISSAAGKIGHASIGTGGYAIAADNVHNRGDAMTLSLWFNNAYANQGTFFFGATSLTANSYDYGLYITSRNLVQYYVYNDLNALSVASGGSLTVGQWIHVAGVYDGSTVVLYIDGIPGTAIAQNRGVRDNGFVTSIFGGWARTRAFGMADDARLYTRALQQAEISYYVAQVNSPGTWGPEISLTGVKRLLKRRSLGQELFNGSLICG